MRMDNLKRIVAIALVELIFTSFAAAQQSKPVAKPKTTQPQGDIFNKTSEGSSSVATSVFEQVSKSVVIVEAQSPTGKIQGSGVVYQSKLPRSRAAGHLIL